MPSFTYPPLRRDNDKTEPAVAMDRGEAPQFPDKWDRTLRIAVSPEQLKALQVGDEVEVTLMAKVGGLNSSTNEESINRNFLEVEVTEVKTYLAQAERDQSDFGAGYRKGPAPLLMNRRHR